MWSQDICVLTPPCTSSPDTFWSSNQSSLPHVLLMATLKHENHESVLSQWNYSVQAKKCTRILPSWKLNAIDPEDSQKNIPRTKMKWNLIFCIKCLKQQSNFVGFLLNIRHSCSFFCFCCFISILFFSWSLQLHFFVVLFAFLMFIF